MEAADATAGAGAAVPLSSAGPASAAGSIPLPLELRAFKTQVDGYVSARLKQFANAFTRRFNPDLTTAQVDLLVSETLATLATSDASTSNQRVLRLVLRHDCQSTGCGEAGCLLCQYNPSRLCKRNLKNKYLIDDHLRAKCGAPLRVELVDETGVCVTDGLPDGMQLEVHVLNGEKYKEICPDNTLLSHTQLHSCIISHHTKALLKRDGGSDDQLRCFLGLERGQGPLSELQVTTSSEALLSGKAPTFRLLVWAVDSAGEPVPNVTYVVSENFVVATKRVKHAIKSDIPSVADSVSKLVHIGKATVDKLVDLRSAAREEGFEINLPDELNRIDKVGHFQQLMEQCEMNSDLKNKIRHLLKLSPEKWEEVSQHALAAVVPDFRNRVWWCPNLRTGLLFACKNGSVAMEHPVALVKMGATSGDDDQVMPIHQLDPVMFRSIPTLKQQAVQSWYAASHPGWAIYWKDGQDTGELANVLNFARNLQGGRGGAGSDANTPPPGSAGAGGATLPPPPELNMGQLNMGQHKTGQPPLSPFEVIAKPTGEGSGKPGGGGSGGGGGTIVPRPVPASPFTSNALLNSLSDFPWASVAGSGSAAASGGAGDPVGAAAPLGGGGGGFSFGSFNLPSGLDMPSLHNLLGASIDPNMPGAELAQLLNASRSHPASGSAPKPESDAQASGGAAAGNGNGCGAARPSDAFTAVAAAGGGLHDGRAEKRARTSK